MISLAREVRGLFWAAVVVTIAAYYFVGWLLALFPFFFTLLLVWVFRDRKREIPSQPLAVVSPIDGKVTSIDMVRDPYLGRTALRIRLRPDWLGERNVHSPSEGDMITRWWRGRVIQAPHAPDRFVWWQQTDESDDIVVAIAGNLPLFFLPVPVQDGERLGQGRRYGLLGPAAYVDVYLASNVRVKVEQDQRILAGSDVLAKLVH